MSNVRRRRKPLEKKTFKKRIKENISLILTVISIFFAIASIVFIIINITAIVNQNETAIKSERNERFKNAIEQLGNEKNPIVLGGIYTLHRIAKEDESYTENVFNILCSYVRETTTTEDYQENYKRKPSEPIQTILNILCVNKKDWKIYRTPKSKLIINFSDAYLRKANLTDANLCDANLIRATLTYAILIRATLTGADLSRAILTNAYLGHANITGADLRSANLTEANLGNATLIATFLIRANLKDAYLEEADLRGAYSSYNNFDKSFKERINSRINKQTDLSGISDGYDPENKPFYGTPIFGAYTKEEAEEIIKKYRDSRSPKSIEN